jgi:hypothetical protein
MNLAICRSDRQSVRKGTRRKVAESQREPDEDPHEAGSNKLNQRATDFSRIAGWQGFESLLIGHSGWLRSPARVLPLLVADIMNGAADARYTGNLCAVAYSLA